jgi:Tfp pilus assembly protein PilV
MSIISAVSMLALELIQSLIAAKEDQAKQEEALMAAEEKLSRIRARMKFG